VSHSTSTELPALSRHDSAVQQIAAKMLSFVNGEVHPGNVNPSWGTYTNCPEKKISLTHRWEGILWPDIVMVDTTRSNLPRLVAEVETEDTINETTLDRKWKVNQDECPIMYLFVPRGTGYQTSELLLKYRRVCKVPRAVFTYEFDPLYQVLITPI